MKNFRNRNAILLTLLVVLPTFMLFGKIITNVNAYTPVPEPHPNNGWGWDANIGDILWFELEVVERNLTGEIIHMFRYFAGLNITSFDTALVDVTGLGTYNLSRVNVTEVWLNPSSGMLETAGAGGTVAYFGYNDSIPSEICVAGDFGIGPMILPLNATAGLDLEYLQDVLKTSYFDPLAADGLYNSFDNSFADNGQRNIFFENTTNGYFINATYFPNGTVNEAEMFFLQKTWNGDYVEMYQKVKRVFNPNLASEVEWGFDIGDTFYFGENNDNEGFQEKKIEITGFNLTTYWGYWSFDPESVSPMVYEDVLADVSIWNPTFEYYMLNATNVTVASANNLYPVLPWQTDLFPPRTPFFFDLNATIEDYHFMQNNFTSKKYVQFDGVNWKTEGKFIYFKMINHTTKAFVNGVWDSNRGVMNFIQGDFGPEGSGFVIFEKNMTIIPSGPNTVELSSELPIPWDITLNFDVTGGDTEVYWALIPGNPTLVPAPGALPHEIGAYIDVYTNNTNNVENVTITIEYDETLLTSFGIDENDLVPMGYEQSWGWGFAPNSMYTIDTTNDLLMVTLGVLNVSYFTIGVNTISRIEWSKDVSDEIFYGQDGHEFRAVITSINETLRELFPEEHSPIEMFSEVYADLYFWDKMNESWILKNTSVLVAAANNYWPMAPYYFPPDITTGPAGPPGPLGAPEPRAGPPLLYPMGTTGFNFDRLVGIYGATFDDIILEYNSVSAYNNATGIYDITFLDVPSGVPLLEIGKRPGGMGLEYYSFYHKIRAPLSMGNNHLTLEADLIPDLSFGADITALSGGSDFLFAILPVSPVQEEIPNGTLLFYSDVMFTDHTKVSQISMFVTLPIAISVDAITLMLFVWSDPMDNGGMFGYWEAMDHDQMNQSVVYDVDTNSIILTFEVNNPIAGVFAWAFVLSSEELPEIPGYDLFIILGLLGVTSGIIISRRRKLMDN